MKEEEKPITPKDPEQPVGKMKEEMIIKAEERDTVIQAELQDSQYSIEIKRENVDLAKIEDLAFIKVEEETPKVEQKNIVVALGEFDEEREARVREKKQKKSLYNKKYYAKKKFRRNNVVRTANTSLKKFITEGSDIMDEIISILKRSNGFSQK